LLASYTYSPYREPSEKVLTELIGSKSGIDILGDYKYERLDMDESRENEELSVTEFEKEPSQSNRIWVNNRFLEDWIEGTVGRSPCCDVCSPHDCRTVEVEGQIYEIVPAETIVKAGLLAASQLVSPQTGKSSCGDV